MKRTVLQWLFGEDERGFDLNKKASPAFIILMITLVIGTIVTLIFFN